eukprot:Polyplicarium_translucidae@DN2616_c0_g2_i2.p1
MDTQLQQRYRAEGFVRCPALLFRRCPPQAVWSIHGSLCLANLPTGGVSQTEIHPGGRIVSLSYCAAASAFVTAGDDKHVGIVRLPTLDVPNRDDHTVDVELLRVPKRASSAALIREGERLVFADTFGDIYSVPLGQARNWALGQENDKQDCDDDEDDEKVGEGSEAALVPACGHFAAVTAMAVSVDESRLYTGDREAKIFVTALPEAHTIEAVLLGHSGVITALLQPPGCPNALVSAASDLTIRVWDTSDGGRLMQTVGPLEDLPVALQWVPEPRPHDEDGAAAIGSILVQYGGTAVRGFV